MFESLQDDGSLTRGGLGNESRFGGPMLVPVLDRESSPVDESDVPAFDPVREAMEQTIATLQEALTEKEHAIVQSAIAASSLHQQLDKSKTHNEQLRKKLTTVAKAHEALSQKVAAAEQSGSVNGRQIPEAEVAQMKEKWRVAQKSMEREYGRLQGELAKAKIGLHQATQELETQTRARRSDAAHASLRIANLEREVESARAGAAQPGVAEKGGNLWLRLSVTSATTAAIMIATWFCWPSLHDYYGKVSAEPRIAASAPVTSGYRQTGALSGLNAAGSREAFQKALGRLNNILYGPVGVTPEQILRAVRESNAKTDPGVCNFQWNNGQPALYFGGADTSLGASLDRCATAVDQYLRPGDKPATTLTSKK